MLSMTGSLTLGPRGCAEQHCPPQARSSPGQVPKTEVQIVVRRGFDNLIEMIDSFPLFSIKIQSEPRTSITL